MSGLVEDLGDGSWLIIPTSEIKTCSRSTAYRYAKKASDSIDIPEDAQNLESETHDDMKLDIEDEDDSTPIEDEEAPTLEITSETFEDISIEAPVFDLPSLDDLKKGGDGGENPDTFQGDTEELSEFAERDANFIDAIKGAKVVEDDEGNKKIHLKDILIGDNPLIVAMLGGLDNTLYAWAENKHGMTLWDKDSRRIQRTVFVKTLSIIAPKTSIEVDPHWVIIGLGLWLYGVPLVRIARATAKQKKALKVKVPSYENQEPVIYDGE